MGKKSGKLTKDELTLELMLDMVNFSMLDPYLASIGVTDSINKVLLESITSVDRFWTLYVK